MKYVPRLEKTLAYINAYDTWFGQRTAKMPPITQFNHVWLRGTVPRQFFLRNGKPARGYSSTAPWGDKIVFFPSFDLDREWREPSGG
jgi:hypothetical protein